MKKMILCACFALGMFLFSAFAPCEASEAAPMPVTVYLYDPCGGCAGVLPGCGDCTMELALSNALSSLLRTQREDGRIVLRLRNVLDPEYEARYRETLQSMARMDAYSALPAFLIGEGADAILRLGEESLPALPAAVEEALTRWDDTATLPETKASPLCETEVVTLPRQDMPCDVEAGDSVIVYFYKTACPYCQEIGALIHGLPKTITLEDGTQSAVRLLALDKNLPDQMNIVQAYYDLMQIPEARQYVPMIVIGGRDLFLYDEIVPGLLPALFSGEGLKTPLSPYGLDWQR